MKTFKERMCSDYDSLMEYVEELHEICKQVVVLRGQGWQKRQQMHDMISKMGTLIGIGPHMTGHPASTIREDIGITTCGECGYKKAEHNGLWVYCPDCGESSKI
jgi:hypothetical protein